MDGRLILDRYRPLSTLGEGGNGEVELAWDTRMQRRVAIKRIALSPLVRDAGIAAPGLAEARTAAMLNHPAIVTVFDFDADADEGFLVMEYVDGCSLAALLDHVDGPLTLDEAAAVLEAVSGALEFAHDNGVLHLDIKPENVLVTRDGRVKVADFGLAELSSVYGHRGAFGGTPGYMPIEQASGESVSSRTDQWALGVLVFEMLTGINPFAAPDADRAVRILNGSVTPHISSYSKDVPAELDDPLLKALSGSASQRYGDVGDFTDDVLSELGDPTDGRRSLAELVAELSTEEPEGDPGLDEVGAWDRMRGPLGVVVLRAAASVEAAWLAWSGLAPFGLEITAAWAAVGLVALAAALAPSLGVALGLGCLAAGLMRAQAWLVGGGVILVGAAWWWFLARRSTGASVLPLAAPVLGAFNLAPAQPLIAGFALSPLSAASTALVGGILTQLAAAVSSGSTPYLHVWAPSVIDVWSTQSAVTSVYGLIGSPASYVALLGWPLSASIMSWACRNATRTGAAIGAFAGSAVLGAFYYLATRSAAALGQDASWWGTDSAVAIGLSLILMLLLVLLGAPLRPEEDAVDDGDDEE